MKKLGKNTKLKKKNILSLIPSKDNFKMPLSIRKNKCKILDRNNAHKQSINVTQAENRNNKNQTSNIKIYKYEEKTYYSLTEILAFLKIFFQVDYENFILKVSEKYILYTYMA